MAGENPLFQGSSVELLNSQRNMEEYKEGSILIDFFQYSNYFRGRLQQLHLDSG
jgi:hypothetical protein